MPRTAAVDCGTNSIRLLVADVDADAGTDRRRPEDAVVRLGQGVDRPGRLSEALARTFAAWRLRGRDRRARCRAGALRGHQRQPRRRATAPTSSTGFSERSAPSPRSSPATRRPRCPSTARPASSTAADGPFLVVDIGGGSTEFVLGTDTVPTPPASVDVGCVRLTERHLHDDPPTAGAGRRRPRRRRRRARRVRQTVAGRAGAHRRRAGRLGDDRRGPRARSAGVRQPAIHRPHHARPRCAR